VTKRKVTRREIHEREEREHEISKQIDRVVHLATWIKESQSGAFTQVGSPTVLEGTYCRLQSRVDELVSHVAALKDVTDTHVRSRSARRQERSDRMRLARNRRGPRLRQAAE
jgi:hypothetical protein